MIKMKSFKFLIAAFLFVVIGATVLFWESPRHIVDESFHGKQIKRIYREDPRFVEGLTTIPGYHYALAYIGRITNPIFDYGEHPKIREIRVFHLVFSFILPIILFFLVKKLEQNKELVFILTAMPIAFIFSLMVYTDIPSLVFFLCALFFHMKKQYGFASLFMILDIAIRQDNVIWLGFLISILLYEVYQKYNKVNKYFVQEFLTSSLGYLIVIFIFSIFYVFNGGVAIGDKTAHPSMSFHFENIWVFFALFSFMFLPLVVFEFKNIFVFFAKRKVLSIFLIILGYFIFIYTFVADHPYNQSIWNYLHNLIYLHNVVAYYTVHSLVVSIFIYTLAVFSIGYILVRGFVKRKYIIFLPFGLLSLSLHWLIEFRYSLIPMVVIFLIIHHRSVAMRYQVIYTSILSIILFYICFIYKDIFL
jgi:alpha-1,2-glucosyltransferase